MDRRAMWKGVITFGAVRVPVKLYSAVHDIRIDFDLLHDSDSQPLRQVMVCSVEGMPVETEHQVRGVKIEGEFVVVSHEELAALEPEPSRDIQIKTFVSPEEIDVRAVEKGYYLGVDADPALYASLVTALTKTGKVGICQWVMRKRAYLGALQAIDGLLHLTTLRYAGEIAAADFEIASVAITDREREMASYLIDELSGDFHPENYQPEFIHRLRELIEQKARGEQVHLEKPIQFVPTAEPDLLRVLENSLREARKRHAS